MSCNPKDHDCCSLGHYNVLYFVFDNREVKKIFGCLFAASNYAKEHNLWQIQAGTLTQSGDILRKVL